MHLNDQSEPVFTSRDLIQEIYKGNISKINLAKVDCNDIDYISFVEFVTDNNLDWPLPEPYLGNVKTIPDFDSSNQNNWYMPDSYKEFDIEKYLLSLCENKEQTERVTEELHLFKKHNMLPLLCFLKYLVDTMRDNKILWGVGRGSSVASYSLYLLGIHKIDSIKYELDIREFLR